jgi:hypothetical protein
MHGESVVIQEPFKTKVANPHDLDGGTPPRKSSGRITFRVRANYIPRSWRITFRTSQWGRGRSQRLNFGPADYNPSPAGIPPPGGSWAGTRRLTGGPGPGRPGPTGYVHGLHALAPDGSEPPRAEAQNC